MSLTHIETIELTSSQANITFSSIPQDYDDLIVKLSLRTDRSGATDPIEVRPNGSTTNGSSVYLYGNGSITASSTYASDLVIARANGNTSTSNTFGNTNIYASGYTSSSAKSFSSDMVTENNATQADQYIFAGLWSSTAAITSLVLISSFTGSNFMAGSTVSLYGVTAGGDGTVTTA